MIPKHDIKNITFVLKNVNLACVCVNPKVSMFKRKKLAASNSVKKKTGLPPSQLLTLFSSCWSI
jgi:hypothetical protein